MGKKTNISAELSAAEWEVMNVIWGGGPLATRDIYAGLAAEHTWAYSTVKTLVRRMVAKGWLNTARVGNSFLYSAAVPRNKAVRSAVKEFSSRVLDGLVAPFVAYFAAEKKLSAKDLAQLEEILNKQRKKGGKP